MIIHSFDYPPLDGGIARLCSEIATTTGGGWKVPIRALSQASAGLSEGNRSPIAEFRVTSRRPWREWEAYRWLCREGKHEAVLCGTWYPEGLLATLAGTRPRVVLAHGSELLPPTARWRRRLWSRLQRAVLERAELIVANSEYTRGLVERAAPRCRVAVVPPAVDTQRFTPGDRAAARRRWDVEGRIVVGTVARLHAYKGIDVVLRALAVLPESTRAAFVYLVAGRGPDLPRLQALSRELGIESLVRWVGFITDDDLPSFYRATDVFVLCTREATQAREVEGFGMVFLEAQACGTPTIGTRSGGIPDAVAPHDGGWLIAPDDQGALTVLCQELASDPDRFRAAGVAARARVTRAFTWQHYRRRLAAALCAEGIHVGYGEESDG